MNDQPVPGWIDVWNSSVMPLVVQRRRRECADRVRKRSKLDPVSGVFDCRVKRTAFSYGDRSPYGPSGVPRLPGVSAAMTFRTESSPPPTAAAPIRRIFRRFVRFEFFMELPRREFYANSIYFPTRRCYSSPDIWKFFNGT